VASESSELMGAFESWLLRHVAQAVEAGEVPATLLGELEAEIRTARERSREEGRAAAVRQIADLAAVNQERVAGALACIEAQPKVTRELLMRQIAEAWLEGQRRAHRGFQ